MLAPEKLNYEQLLMHIMKNWLEKWWQNCVVSDILLPMKSFTKNLVSKFLKCNYFWFKIYIWLLRLDIQICVEVKAKYIVGNKSKSSCSEILSEMKCQCSVLLQYQGKLPTFHETGTQKSSGIGLGKVWNNFHSWCCPMSLPESWEISPNEKEYDLTISGLHNSQKSSLTFNSKACPSG